MATTGAQNLSYRIGYVLGNCMLPALACGIWGFMSKKSWSWLRFAVTVFGFYVLFAIVSSVGRAQR